MNKILILLLLTTNLWAKSPCGYSDQKVIFNQACLPSAKFWQEKNNTVVIINQWHPSAKAKTTDLKKAKKLPHYQNQTDAYLKAERLFRENNIKLVIAEGCEGEIKKDFKKVYYGWNFSNLIKQAHQQDYNKILAHIPSKMKAKYLDKIKVICGDSEELMKKNLLAFSDLNGYLGYYARLKQLKPINRKKYLVYANSLLKELPRSKRRKTDSIGFALKRAKESLKKFKDYIIKRNNLFYQQVQKHSEEKMIIVIGGLHTIDLVERLKKDKRPYLVINPKGYNPKEVKLVQELEKMLEAEKN